MRFTKSLKLLLISLVICLGLLTSTVYAQSSGIDLATLPKDQPVGTIEPVATFSGPMPTGVAVSRSGRIFVNFPKWGDPVEYTVAEVKNGQTVAYPNAEINRSGASNSSGLVSVQSVVVDPLDRLWILDTGSINFAPVQPGGAKLVGVDLTQNRVFKTITFPSNVALPTSYLNDVRFDLRRGRAGTAFITDSSDKGANGIIVVDLDSGRSWRRINDHPSTKAVPNFLPSVEGMPIANREPGQPPRPIALGSDGIAISAEGDRLFYCPLASRRLYSVSIDALVNEQLPEQEVAKTVVDHGEKGGGSDGLESDAQNRIYLTNYEQNAIQRRLSDGTIELVVRDPHMLWPDTLSMASDGYLYFTANQLHRQARYHNGQDLRQKPYSLFRVNVNAEPVSLK
jgi:sugar lactone lactonase YvrE